MYKFKGLTKFSNILFVLVIFLYSATGFVFADMPRIVGIIDDSVYSNSVRVLFYPSDSNAQYKIDGSAYNNCAFGDKFTSNGSYTLEVARPKAISYWASKTCIHQSGDYYIADPYSNDPEGVDTVTGATTINSSNPKFTIETFVNSALLPENVNIVCETNRTASPDTNSLVYRTEINLLTGTNNTPLVFGSYNSIDPVGFSDVNSANFLNEDFSGANSDQYNDLKLQITKIISVNVTPAKKPLSAIYLLLKD
ncbi:MAG: hypothetical protein GY699_17860 [Desulfobacteraceae bacterium]|nr:hypothetical protein [Desulfobacteraceae bacterium]